MKDDFASEVDAQLAIEELQNLPTTATKKALNVFNLWQEQYINGQGWKKIKGLLRQTSYVEQNDKQTRHLSKPAREALQGYASAHDLSLDNAILQLVAIANKQ